MPPGQRLHHLDHVGARPEAVAHLDDVVDEGERPHPAEGLPQREHQHQGELREVGHRAADVAEHDQVGAVRALRTVVGGQRHPARRDRRAHGAAYVEGSAPAGVLLLRQPRCEPAGQGVDLPPHLLEVAAAGGGEVEPVDGRPDGDVGDVLGTLLLGDAPPGVALDQPREVADPAPGRALGLLVVEALDRAAPARAGRSARRATPAGARCRPTSSTGRARGRASPRSGRPPRLQDPATPAGPRRPGRRPAPHGSARGPARCPGARRPARGRPRPRRCR